MATLFVGETLERAREELDAVRNLVEAKALRANRVNVTNGDVRYWGVHLSQSVVLQRLKDFGERCFAERLGRPPYFSFVMVNLVDAATCPAGSGGGWHRDSLRRQFKAFVYLTDV